MSAPGTEPCARGGCVLGTSDGRTRACGQAKRGRGTAEHNMDDDDDDMGSELEFGGVRAVPRATLGGDNGVI